MLSLQNPYFCPVPCQRFNPGYRAGRSICPVQVVIQTDSVDS